MTRFILAAIGTLLAATTLSAQQEIENVAAFARLYGAVRWFYPSDAAAVLDWNRFAVHGVSRVRSARTVPELERSLEDLFTTLGPRIEIGASLSAKPATQGRDASLVGWHYRGAGITEATAGPYSAKRMNRAAPMRRAPQFDPARIAPPPTPPVSQIATPADSVETPIAGATIDIDLGRGLKARMPLALTDAEARTESPQLASLRDVLAKVANPSGKDDADTRLADAVVAWNVLRHFYPYWEDTGIDWDARLRPHLTTALSAPTTRAGHLDAIRSLVADARDGHGNVRDVVMLAQQAALPIQLRILDSRVVVTASKIADVPVGSVVTAINGEPTSTRVQREVQLASGTVQWQETRAARALPLCTMHSSASLTVELPSGASRNISSSCTASATGVAEKRPEPIAQLQRGLWYVDLTRVRAATLRPMLDTLAMARGVVFDVRGYPTDAGSMVLPHLMRTAENPFNRWMHISRIAQPFGGIVGWQDLSWSLQPATQQISGQRVFLTDGRAISYAESVMGYVRDYKLGTIIGGTTAGANGNVASFTLPGGFSMVWTGMRVTRHDGRTPFHTQGVEADIPLEPTLAGIRAGRDEVLERALAVLRVQP